MKIQIDTMTARVNSERLSKEQLNMLLEKNYINWAKSPSGEVRWYGNPGKFEGLTRSPRLHDCFAGRVIDGVFVCPSNSLKWSGEDDMTKLDIESVSGFGLNLQRTWREFEVAAVE
jgi:hypothetical protein